MEKASSKDTKIQIKTVEMHIIIKWTHSPLDLKSKILLKIAYFNSLAIAYFLSLTLLIYEKSYKLCDNGV